MADAPNTATYLLVNKDTGDLPDSRQLTADPDTSNIQLIDTGPGGVYDIQTTLNLGALAEMSTPGFVAFDGSTMVPRTLGGDATVNISNASGAGGNPFIAVVSNTSIQKISVQSAGVPTTNARANVNFISGPNVTVNAVDNSSQNRTDVTISAADSLPLASSLLYTSSTQNHSFNLGSLTSGLLKQSVTSGVATPSIAIVNTDYVSPTTGLLQLRNLAITNNAVIGGSSGAWTAIPATVSNTVLHFDGTSLGWVTQTSGGTVTSVGVTSSDLTVTGSPVTVSGSIGLALNTVPVNKGGTAITTYTTGDILYCNSTNSLAKLAASTNGFILTLAGGIPTWAANSSPSSLATYLTQTSTNLPTNGINLGASAAKLAIGQTSPNFNLDILGTTLGGTGNSLVVPLNVATDAFAGNSNGARIINSLYGIDASFDGAGFQIQGARGTLSSPTAVHNNDVIGGIYAAGYNGLAFGNGQGTYNAGIRWVADQDFTSSNMLTRMEYVLPNGFVSPQVIFDITGDGTTHQYFPVVFADDVTVSGGTTSFSTTPTFTNGAQFTTAGTLAIVNGGSGRTGLTTGSTITSTFNGPTNLAGGSLTGTYSGSPTFSGTVTFTNAPVFSAGISTSTLAITGTSASAFTTGTTSGSQFSGPVVFNQASGSAGTVTFNAGATVTINSTPSFTAGATFGASSTLTFTSGAAVTGTANFNASAVLNFTSGSSITGTATVGGSATLAFTSGSKLTGTTALGNGTVLSTLSVASASKIQFSSGSTLQSDSGSTLTLNGLINTRINQTVTSPSSGTTIDLKADCGATNTTGNYNFYTYSGTNNTGSILAVASAKGSLASPTHVVNGYQFGSLYFGGHDGTNPVNFAAQVIGQATEDWTSGAHGSSIVFNTIPNGSTTARTVGIFDNNGTLTIPIGQIMLAGSVLTFNSGSPGARIQGTAQLGDGTNASVFQVNSQSRIELLANATLQINSGQITFTTGHIAGNVTYGDGTNASLLTFANATSLTMQSGSALTMNGGSKAVFNNTVCIGASIASTTHLLELQADDAVKPGVGGLWTVASDVRIKDDIQDITGALDIINALRPRRYKYTDAHKVANNLPMDDVYEYGFIADEVEEVMADCVTVSNSSSGDVENLKMLNMGGASSLLYKAIQELSEKINDLTTQNQQLVSRLDSVEAASTPVV